MEREAEAMKEELGLGGWQPAAGQDIINSTTTTTTISTAGNGLFSMQYNGAQFLVSEEGNKLILLIGKNHNKPLSLATYIISI